MNEKVIEETIKAFLLVEAIAPNDFNNNNNNNNYNNNNNNNNIDNNNKNDNLNNDNNSNVILDKNVETIDNVEESAKNETILTKENNNNNNSNSNQIHELCIKHNLLDIYDKLTIAMNFNSIEQLAMADDNDTEEMIQFLGLKFGNKASLKLLIKDAKKQYNTIINNESTASLQEGKVNDEINKKTDKKEMTLKK